MKELPKGPYNPQETEERTLEYWLDNQFYKPEYDPEKKGLVSTEEMKNDSREPFCIICPPPNAYARPHLGNISGYAYQDVFGRYARMQGKKVLLFPGKDHAAQEAESIFTREVLAPEGKSKEDFTREEFYSEAYSHFEKLMELALKDEMRIGLSADFERNTFTLDPRIHKTVMSTFMKLHTDDLVYKDVRIVNWSTGMNSVIADIDTEYIEEETELTYIKYPILDDKGKETGDYLKVATTRPETMLGDTAVVVDPTDERYEKLVGQNVLLPLVNRKIPVIANGRVDKEFGTGAVKLTPAHSQEDYTIMLEWNYKKDFEHMPENVVKAREELGEIGYINVIWKDSKMVGPIGKYKGMTTSEARAEVVKDLKELDLVDKVENYTHNMGYCSRTKTPIEPIMSSQWFIDVNKFQEISLSAVNKGEVKIHPDYMTKKLLHWLENLRDWPISRSIWWGYRFPVWYKGEVEEFTDEEGKIVQKIGGEFIESMKQATEDGLMKIQEESPGEGWIQDPDVFDTWFSSGQWPFATLIAEDLLDTFYPTQVMETGFDILELWVSRMIMMGEYVQGKSPFSDVYLHGLINGTDGQKMSKSKGNNIEMDDIINEYGADTLRLFYIVGNKAGANYRIDFEKIEGNRRFLNKLWNASKFVMMNLKDVDPNLLLDFEKLEIKQESNQKLLAGLTETKEEVTRLMDTFNIGIAAQRVLNEFWHTFCDECIEEAKPHIYDQKDKETKEVISSPDLEEKQETQLVLMFALKEYLKMLHPFIPFITEEIWQAYPKMDGESETIMYACW